MLWFVQLSSCDDEDVVSVVTAQSELLNLHDVMKKYSLTGKNQHGKVNQNYFHGLLRDRAQVKLRMLFIKDKLQYNNKIESAYFALNYEEVDKK